MSGRRADRQTGGGQAGSRAFFPVRTGALCQLKFHTLDDIVVSYHIDLCVAENSQ